MVLKRNDFRKVSCVRFENDVEMYGAQTRRRLRCRPSRFENDVEMYGAQTSKGHSVIHILFENDVEMYGAQTDKHFISLLLSLRMM